MSQGIQIVEALSIKKNVRLDRKNKLLDSKKYSETVVKCSLKSLVVEEQQKQLITDSIDKRVIAFSKRINAASVSLSYIVKMLFHNVKDVTTVNVPDILDQTFIRQLMLGTDGTSKANVLVKNLFKECPYLLHNSKDRLPMDSNIYSFGATKFITNIKNHLFLNLPKVMRELIKLLNCSDDEYKIMLFGINGWIIRENKSKKANKKLPKKEPPKEELQIPSLKQIVQQHYIQESRRILGLVGSQSIDKKWYKDKDNIPHILKYFIYVSRQIENYNAKQTVDENRKKLFNILPICRIKAHFITIDTSVLYGIMKEVGLTKSSLTTFLELGTEQWNSIFKTTLVKGKYCKFTGTMDTDGVAANFHFKRLIKEKKEETEFKILPTDKVIGIDPGRTNIIYAVEQLGDQTYKSYRLTRKQYYRNAGMTKNTKQVINWNTSIKDELEALSMASPKGSSFETYKTYITEYLRTRNALWNEYLKTHWAQSRLRLYGGKKRVFAKFYNQFKTEGIRTIIAFGAAKFSPTGPGEMAVPTCRSFRECSQRFKTIPIDEFRTTIISAEDDSLLHKVVRNDKNEVVRGLLWCCSTKKNKLVNRDLNAAINIRRCLTLPKRPDILTRSKCEGRVNQRIGCTIIR